jgi:hypothetical protein
VAALPAITLRATPVQLTGSGFGGPAGLTPAADAFASLLQQVASGDIVLDVDPVPLADVTNVWAQPDSGRRIVFVP